MQIRHNDDKETPRWEDYSKVMASMDWEDLLAHVEKPSRYLGTEINARHPGREAELHFALAFPDTYEVGMSHLGIQILYELLNGIPGLAAERCFAPWPDMEKLLRQQQLPLTSLESHRPLQAFDILGFSLQYELSYTNVLNMLELGGIPLLRIERQNTDPLVIAGGPGTFNPAPMEDFIDAFVIGEGEEVIGEIAATALKMKRMGASRADTLAALAEIAGLYVPAFYQAGTRIRKRLVSDLNQWPLPTRPVVPLMKTIHDRITLEIARGCTRGCRFCQAGMVWRPVRERRQEEIEAMAAGLLCATGYDEISLLSLSSGDYSRIEPLLTTLMERYYEQRVALGLPSLRVETLTRSLIENIRRVRKTSFTLAPEAGTQRLRDLINKGNTAEELLHTTEQVFAAGWKAVKLYFMLGLPGEEKEDLEGIAELAYQVLRTGKQQNQVTVSLSTFVPKPHTPFQWERQISRDETKEKQLFIKNSIRHRNINIKWHDSRMSLLEGIFARGDARTGR
ncbi:MAG: TIGR03960 family B12-binding radical SAM protein, partial [Syntrophales bacterium]